MINPGASFCNRDVMKFFHVFKVCTDNATNLLKVIKHECSFSLRFKVVNLFLGRLIEAIFREAGPAFERHGTIKFTHARRVTPCMAAYVFSSFYPQI